MLSPSARLPFNPMEASVTEGAQSDGAPAQVSRTNMFWGVPGIRLTPSEEANTKTE
jgi:hypothetical protein